MFAVLPGLVDTEGLRGLGFPFSFLSRLIFRTPEQGARTPLWVAQEPGLARLPDVARDAELADEVYALCEKAIKSF